MTKKKFILDVCTVINAAMLCDSRGNRDTSSLAAITNIIHKCHHIVLTKELESEYYDKLEKLGENLKMDISHLLLLASLTTGKIIKKPSRLQPVADEELIHKNDVFLLRLSRVSQGIIVSSDERLCNAMEKHEFEKKYGIQCKKPSDIIDQYLKE
ncbi:MAG: hypothetical protein ACTSPV_15430 [Candidatus Hodarchaeales archaeon]